MMTVVNFARFFQIWWKFKLNRTDRFADESIDMRILMDWVEKVIYDT